MPTFYAMLVKTVFMLKPLEARNAAAGTDNTQTQPQTLQLIDRIGLRANSVKRSMNLDIILGLLGTLLK